MLSAGRFQPLMIGHEQTKAIEVPITSSLLLASLEPRVIRLLLNLELGVRLAAQGACPDHACQVVRLTNRRQSALYGRNDRSRLAKDAT